MLCALSKFLFFKILKWDFEGEFPKNQKKYIIAIVPHTSWIDFSIGILVRGVLKMKVYYIGKSALFKWPYSCIFKFLGGIPVNRKLRENTVNKMVQLFQKNKEFILCLSPEGTRKKVQKWKTGFYYIAQKAKVPIVMVALDFEHKKIRIAQSFTTTNNFEEDMYYLKNYFKDVKGKLPERS